jgi:hypothetical protein
MVPVDRQLGGDRCGEDPSLSGSPRRSPQLLGDARRPHAAIDRQHNPAPLGMALPTPSMTRTNLQDQPIRTVSAIADDMPRHFT